jgi:hypothetical protein
MPTEIDQVVAEVAQIKDFVARKVEEGTKPLREETSRMAKALEDAQAVINELRRQQVARVTESGRIKVREGKLAGFSAFDLAIAEAALKLTLKRRGDERSWQQTKLGTLIVDGRKAIRGAIGYESVDEWSDMAIRAAKDATPGVSTRSMHRYHQNVMAFQGEMREVVGKALDSTTAAAGDELVPTFESSEVWMDVNLATNVLPLLTQVPMPTNPYDLPHDFGDTNWYPITENVQVTTTDPTTAKNTLTAYGLKTGVPFSDELAEDAIISLVPTLRAGLVRNAAEVIDDVLLNADTTATNGINSDGATISASTAGKAQWLLGFDGLIHLPLVDNTGQRVDLNAAVGANTAYNRALRLLGKYAAPAQRGDVVFIGDVNTIIATLGEANVLTVDKFGSRATIVAGELASLFSIPLIASEQMRLADTDGKVTDTGNVTSTGRILAFNTTQWRVGFRRGITVEPDRDPGKGQTVLYVSMRPALVARGTRSSATHTSLIYDITTVT